MKPTSVFGRRLRAARKALGMSQADLGAILGLEDANSAAPRISRYELGQRDPDPATTEALAKALGVPAAYFHATSDVMAEAILLLSQLTVEQQKAAVSALKKQVAKAKG
jgi:transcriptional regulator with XRE-family HTH domain